MTFVHRLTRVINDIPEDDLAEWTMTCSCGQQRISADRTIAFDALHAHIRKAMTPSLDPDQVWTEMRAGDGETYLVKSHPGIWLGTPTGRKVKITRYESWVVEE